MNANSPWTQLPHLAGADPGRIFHAARITRGWSVAEAGARCGYSGSTVSRWERNRRNWTLEDLSRVASAFGVPGHLIGLVDSSSETPSDKVLRTSQVGQDGPMKRRTLFAASLTAVTAATFSVSFETANGIERALFKPSTSEPITLRLLAGRVSAAKTDLDTARLAELNRRLPDLISAAHSTWKAARGDDRTYAASLFSRTLAITGQQQLRLSKDPIASVAADRATRHAKAAGDPLAAAEAARTQAMVLRRTGCNPVANHLMVSAAEQLKADTSLTSTATAGMYAQILATAAYTAAQTDNRDDTAAYLEAAAGAISPFSKTSVALLPSVDAYVISCHRVLGDYGTTLHQAKDFDIASVADTHGRGRFWQDVAIAAQGRGQIDVAVEALAELDSIAPQYLHHRPWASNLLEGLLRTRTGGASPLTRRLAGQLKLA